MYVCIVWPYTLYDHLNGTIVKYHMFVPVPKMTLYHKFLLYENYCTKNHGYQDWRYWCDCFIFLKYASITTIGGNPAYVIMSTCSIFQVTSCIASTKNNSQCRLEHQKWRAGPIESGVPKVVKFTSQSMPSQNRVVNIVFQQVQVNATQKKLLVEMCVWIIHI